MPLHLDRLSRRSFLGTTLGVGAGLVAFGCAQRPFKGFSRNTIQTTEKPAAPERWALLSDTHIAADPEQTSRGVKMAEQLRRAVEDVLAMNPAPGSSAGVIFNGDCARQRGRAGDYRTFRELGVDPLVGRELPVHLTLGNHDHRGRFLSAFRYADAKPHAAISAEAAPLVEGRFVSVVRGRYVNWVLLDTLDETGRVSGRLGQQQLAWLDAALASLNDAPVLVVGHHPRGGDEVDLLRRFGSLRDGGPLWDVLRRHAEVKAYIYGHTHRWDVTERDGIYLINLPATSFAFDRRQPTGWVDLALHPAGAELTMHRLGGAPLSDKAATVKLTWSLAA